MRMASMPGIWMARPESAGAILQGGPAHGEEVQVAHFAMGHWYEHEGMAALYEPTGDRIDDRWVYIFAGWNGDRKPA